jgi:hypothetical protein
VVQYKVQLDIKSVVLTGIKGDSGGVQRRMFQEENPVILICAYMRVCLRHVFVLGLTFVETISLKMNVRAL